MVVQKTPKLHKTIDQAVKKRDQEQKRRLLTKLGKRIKTLRMQKGMTQSQLAWAMHKDPQSLERVENAKTNPTIFYLHEIARGLDVPVKELLDF